MHYYGREEELIDYEMKRSCLHDILTQKLIDNADKGQIPSHKVK